MLTVPLKAILFEPSISIELPNASAAKLPAESVPTVILFAESMVIVVLPALTKLDTVNQSVATAPVPPTHI